MGGVFGVFWGAGWPQLCYHIPITAPPAPHGHHLFHHNPLFQAPLFATPRLRVTKCTF